MPTPQKKRRAASKRRKASKGGATRGRTAKTTAAKRATAPRKPGAQPPARARRSGATGRALRTAGGPGRIERPTPEDEAAFTALLIESGEAARLDEHGKLPAGATHKVVEDEAGNVKVVRRRFSIS